MLAEAPRGTVFLSLYLVTIFSVKQNPSKFDTFSRVFGHVNTVFIASRSNVNYHITLEFGGVGGGDVAAHSKNKRLPFSEDGRYFKTIVPFS